MPGENTTFLTFLWRQIATKMSSLAMLSFALVALSEALQCKSGQCSLQSVSCTDQPSLCEMTSAGPLVMDLESAKLMCANASLELVVPGDLATNDEMKQLCPTASFFDIEPQQAQNVSDCNSFVVASTGESPAFVNWGSTEPNNANVNANSSNNCSRGRIVEGCVGFLPRSVTLKLLRFFFFLPVSDHVSTKKSKWHDRKCSSYGAQNAHKEYVQCFCVVCGKLKSPPGGLLPLPPRQAPSPTKAFTSTSTSTSTTIRPPNQAPNPKIYTDGTTRPHQISPAAPVTTVSESTEVLASASESPISNNLLVYVLVPLLVCALLSILMIILVRRWRHATVVNIPNAEAQDEVDTYRYHATFAEETRYTRVPSVSQLYNGAEFVDQDRPPIIYTAIPGCDANVNDLQVDIVEEIYQSLPTIKVTAKAPVIYDVGDVS